MEKSTEEQLALERYERVKRELAILYDVSHAMRSTLDLDKILYIILTGVTAHSGLGFNRAILFLVNEKERCLEPQMAIGPKSAAHAQKIWKHIQDAKKDLNDLTEADTIAQNIKTSPLLESLKDVKIPLETHSGNLLANVFHQGEARHVTQAEMYTLNDDILLENFSSSELVTMPLKAKNTVNGIIVADNLFTRKAISEDDMKMFTMLANQAGLAIENSRLYEMVKHKSDTDALTGLWNHGYFQSELEKTIIDCQASDTTTNLIFMDIDNFKSINDRFGHRVGDIILQHIAQIISESSRDIDTACRYGGEEFTIILPKTTQSQTLTIAERLRERIANYEFNKYIPNYNENVTLSLGVASYPQDASSKDELIVAADKAMYIAKFSGKNRVCSIRES